MSVLHIGGVRDRWEFLVSGPAFVQAFTALDRRLPGQVVVSLRAWSHINVAVLAAASCRWDRCWSKRRRATTCASWPIRKSHLTETMAAGPAYATFPAAVNSRLSAGQENWLGELRVVSVLFVNLPELELRHATGPRPTDRCATCKRNSIASRDSLNKLNVDDKGTSLLAAMGMPPLGPRG